jgi:hypothetical protein
MASAKRATAKPALMSVKPRMPDGVRRNPTPMAIDAAQQRDNVREFMRAMSVELSVLAANNGMKSLATIFELARAAADADAVAAGTPPAETG